MITDKWAINQLQSNQLSGSGKGDWKPQREKHDTAFVSAICLRKKTQLSAADMHMGWKKSWQLLSKDRNHPRFDWHIQRKFPMNHLCLTWIVIEAPLGKSPYYSSKKFTTIQIKKITTKQKIHFYIPKILTFLLHESIFVTVPVHLTVTIQCQPEPKT